MRTSCCSVALFALVFGMPLSALADMDAIGFQAESGTLGSDFITGDSAGVVYISNTNNNVGFTSNRPQILSRVASYTVKFPDMGTYELYARLRVGPAGPNDDAFFYGNGFGAKDANTADDWIEVQGIEGRGFTDPTNLVVDGGSAGITVWKWVNLSQDTGSAGELPITFTVLDGLTQTFLIGGRNDGLDLDKFVFRKVGYPLAVADLDAVATPEPPTVGEISVSKILSNGNLTISYSGNPNHNYVAERADSLSVPMTWTPLLTNAADSAGQLTLTNTPTGPQEFYRFRSVSPAPAALPLVYDVEHTGASYPAPPLPTLGNLPFIEPLPDPFCWANDPLNMGGTRSTDFSDWSHRRAEIKAQIEHYEIGLKPAVDLEDIAASFVYSNPSNGVLTVIVTNAVSGTNRTLPLSCSVFLPAGSGPFPAIIGMNSPNGSIPADLVTSRGIARIAYFHNQVTTYGNPQNTDPYYQLYPALNIDNTGQYSAWAWGVSRIIDGLAKVQGVLPVDLEHLAVSGCSYAGKMALFSGALDERVALTISQESGGGGATSWRYSNTEPTGTVEGLAQTDHNWFKEDMFQFGGANVSYLPEDHHMLMAMVAPRALFATGNPDFIWLSNPSCYVACRAAQQVYETFGIGDRFGYNIVGGHGHCATTANIDAEIGAFLDKFMLGDTNANTLIRTAPSYGALDYSRWSAWWGTTNPAFTDVVPDEAYTITLEAECGAVGTNWNVVTDGQASNGRYAEVTLGVQSLWSPPVGVEDLVTIHFSLTNSGNFAVFGRVNCTTTDDDSFWVKMDDGAFVMRNGLRTSGWDWRTLNSYALTAGDHTLTVGYREEGAKLDKISISTWSGTPTGLGQPAENLCDP